MSDWFNIWLLKQPYVNDSPTSDLPLTALLHIYPNAQYTPEQEDYDNYSNIIATIKWERQQHTMATMHNGYHELQ